jgi:membrane protein implicated in regulation of membrane protease activity
VSIPLRAITAVLYAASIGVVVGILGCIYTQRLDLGLHAALAGFAVTAAILVYAFRRTYRRPRSAFLGRAHHNW